MKKITYFVIIFVLVGLGIFGLQKDNITKVRYSTTPAIAYVEPLPDEGSGGGGGGGTTTSTTTSATITFTNSFAPSTIFTVSLDKTRYAIGETAKATVSVSGNYCDGIAFYNGKITIAGKEYNIFREEAVQKCDGSPWILYVPVETTPGDYNATFAITKFIYALFTITNTKSASIPYTVMMPVSPIPDCSATPTLTTWYYSGSNCTGIPFALNLSQGLWENRTQIGYTVPEDKTWYNISSSRWGITCTNFTPYDQANLYEIHKCAVPVPDLTASAPTQTTAVIGTSLNFTSSITNNGNTTTGTSFYNVFQAATDSSGTGTVTNILATPSPMSALGTGSSATATASYTFTGSAGTRSVRFCADNNTSMVGSIAESSKFEPIRLENEANNCSAWVNVAVAAAPIPELTASAPTQTTAVIGTSLNFTSSITNNGNTTTGTSFYNVFQAATDSSGTGTVTNILATPSPMSALGTGSSATATASYTFTGSAGTRSVRFCADNNTSMVGSIAESSEANNCSAWVNVTVLPVINGSCSATHYNCNAGTSASNAESSPNWTWTCNGSNGGTNASCSQPIPPPTNFLSSCSSSGATASFSWTLPSGYSLSYFRIKDNTTNTYPSSWIPENVFDTGPATSLATTPEHNYSAWIHTRLSSGAYSSSIDSSFTCASTPIVVLADLTASAPAQTTAVIGTPMNFTSVISNSGGITDHAFYNSFQVATGAGGSGPITPLIYSTPSPMRTLATGASDTAAYSYTFTGSAGTRSVRFCADNNVNMVGSINESNETNNCSPWVNVTVVVIPSPTATISAYPTAINQGQSSTLTWSSTSADYCISDFFLGRGATSGSRIVTPASLPKTYNLSCVNTIRGEQASDQATVSVTIKKNPIFKEN